MCMRMGTRIRMHMHMHARVRVSVRLKDLAKHMNLTWIPWYDDLVLRSSTCGWIADFKRQM